MAVQFHRKIKGFKRGSSYDVVGISFKNSNRHFFPYAYMSEVAFDIEGRLTILTSEREIVIEGRGLDNLEEWIFESRVTWVQEDNRSFDPHEEGVYISSIEVKPR